MVLAYVVGPLALGLLVVFRYFGLVARAPIWAYLIAIGGSALASMAVEPWHSAPAGSVKLHTRLAIHVLAVTAVIYMSGWGPALGMAYAFVALQELQTWGAFLWRPVLAWSLLNIALAQVLVWYGLLPSLLSRSQAEAIGALGAFVLAIVIRMAGATGEKKERAEAQLAHQALHDMLTGLPNRGMFYERTEDVLDRAKADGSSTAVMLFDLDRFKEINDTMGHNYGDRVLTEVGPRVTSVLRDGDTLARLGGDEFCVLLPRVHGESDAVQVANRIIAVLEFPFEVEGTILGIEASCGISLAPADGHSADLLLQRADVAMYVAKESQAHVVVYRNELDVNTPDRLALLGDFRAAVARGEFVLHYQPKASLRTGQVEGAEALVRWKHPTLGLLYPDSFIPEAERTGLIEPITHWVLDEALHQWRRWMDGTDRSDSAELSVAVNLSTRSLLDAVASRGGPGGGGPVAGSGPPARPRDHRDHHHDRPRPGPTGAHRAGPDGRDPLDRRLRYRVLLTGLPARPAGPPTEDRPDLCPGHGGRLRRRGHRPGRGGPGPQSGAANHRRGGRGPRDLGAAQPSSAATVPRASSWPAPCRPGSSGRGPRGSWARWWTPCPAPTTRTS